MANYSTSRAAAIAAGAWARIRALETPRVVAATASGAALNVDLDNRPYTYARVTLGNASTTINFTNVAPGSRCFLELKQDATGGRDATFPGTTWVPVGPPAIDKTAGAIGLYEFSSPDGSARYGFPISQPAAVPGLFQSPTRYENMPRVAGGSVLGLSSGFINWAYFPPLDSDRVFSTIYTSQRGTAASGGTLTRVVVGAVSGASQDRVDVRGRAASNSTRWASGATGLNTDTIAEDAVGAAISNVAFKAGEIPAVGVLFVGTTAPQLQGGGQAATAAALFPRLAATSGGAQADITAAAYTGQSALGGFFWAALG